MYAGQARGPKSAVVPSRDGPGARPQSATARARRRADAATLSGMRPVAFPVARRLRAVALLAPLSLAPLALATPVAAPAASGPAAGSSWSWPLEPRPALLAPFDAPAGPFAPGHRGADLAAVVDQPVLAAGPGVVAFAGQVAGRGVVSVQHPDGHRTTYEPVAPSAPAGRGVDVGEVLGSVTAGPGHCLPRTCLHWGLLLDGRYLDPLSLVSGDEVRLLPVWSPLREPWPVPGPASPNDGAGSPDRGPLLAGERGGWPAQSSAGRSAASRR